MSMMESFVDLKFKSAESLSTDMNQNTASDSSHLELLNSIRLSQMSQKEQLIWMTLQTMKKFLSRESNHHLTLTQFHL
jgi:hypothetical protein